MTTSPTKMNMTNPQRNFSRCFLGTQCGGEAGIPCPSTYFCELYAGDCIRVSDSFGECVKIPEGCVAGGSGVCSCDGKTYTNDCERQMKSQSKAYDGPCSVDAGN